MTLLQRPALIDHADMSAEAANIIAAVRTFGDSALYDFATQFDGCTLDQLKISEAEIDAAEDALSLDAKAAIDVAISNVRRFHQAQVPSDIDVEIGPGIRCERVSQPIDAVGLYVPAGSAPLPSTAIMLAVPAAIAECPQRILCTPPDKQGNVNAATLVAAWRSGITDIFKVGGAQAIAAMAYGTETIPKTDRICGPGSARVTAAKTLVASDPNGASIDFPAGPSEVLVIADACADPAFVAADLLSQAEHGEDSQVILLTDSRSLAEATVREVTRQLQSLPRQEIASKALESGRVVLTGDIATAIEISNNYAPEHLILQIENARTVLPQVRNAGSVFLGRWAPESVGDYCSGTNHVLPTYGVARSYSGLGVDQFMRQMTVQELTGEGLRSLAPAVLELSALEGLDAHGEAVRIRLLDVVRKAG
ncbi:MAG: histidinol dehydrogenase [Woeseiaceae bacterium]|nr:histidinol dehydrogenase [Woeseiaceae bacterium]